MTCGFRMYRGKVVEKLRLQLGGWVERECIRASTCLLCVEDDPMQPYVTLIRCWLSDRNLTGVDMESLLHSAQRHGLHKASGAE